MFALFLLVGGFGPLASCGREPAPEREIVLWAWERPEDLRFLQPGEARVAVLVATFTLDGEAVRIYGRRQKLELPPGLWPIPVVRIESQQPSLSPAQRQRLLSELARRADPAAVPALQVDFDAKQSERSFYRQLLQELAARLGPRAPLSITALASWCLDDRWLEGLPIAEAVPMLFDMGREGEGLQQRLAGNDFREPLCRGSYGLASYQPWPPLAAGRKVYLFSRQPWNRELFAGLAKPLRAKTADRPAEE